MSTERQDDHYPFRDEYWRIFDGHYPNTHMRAPRTRVNDSCGDVYQVADENWTGETDPGDIGRDDIGAGPVGSARVGGLVDPAHDPSSANLAVAVDVGRAGAEAQGGARGGALC